MVYDSAHTETRPPAERLRTPTHCTLHAGHRSVGGYNTLPVFTMELDHRGNRKSAAVGSTAIQRASVERVVGMPSDWYLLYLSKVFERS